ncbi:hypothetical protein CALVIDRAFT_268466 [Calocera viscosa TUFC12733]|uniref:RRM domain-containing protein n=1 Tax=Calocera viscosa (strain TUFC12733) TaxID=1330018 RepID=A0A167IZT5_CALVF|nr:hypothetical protein CALVIDRAFT_268466 [Calocera viscosa TUFC12733]
MPDGYNERASPKQLIAQGQLSARPSPRLHPSASMPNIWQGESTSPLSARTPSRLRLIPDDAHNGQMVSPLGLTIPTGTRTSDARAPGQPLTPPLSPNAPTTRQSPQQNMVGVTRISPFRASPPQFDPFSSYNFNMLPSPARSAHRTQQPIAEDAQEGIFSSPGQVQFPRTEQQPALVADTEQDDSSNGSPTLVSPTSLVSPSTHRTRLESPINILDYDAGIQRSGRLLFVNHVPRDATNEELTNNFSVLGALKGLYRRYLATDGVVILAFFDMRDAAAAHRYHLRTRRFFKENVSLESTFISPTQLAKQLGNSCFVDVCEGEVYISTMGEGTLNQTALQNALASYGGLRQFRVVGSHGKVSIFILLVISLVLIYTAGVLC